MIILNNKSDTSNERAQRTPLDLCKKRFEEKGVRGRPKGQKSQRAIDGWRQTFMEQDLFDIFYEEDLIGYLFIEHSPLSFLVMWSSLALHINRQSQH